MVPKDFKPLFAHDLLKYITTLCFVYILSFSSGNSQGLRRTDLQNNEPQRVADTARWDRLFDSFVTHVDSNFDSALIYSNQLYTEALSIGDSLKMAIALRALGAVKRSMGHQEEALKDLEVAFRIASQNNFNEVEKYVLNELAIAHTFLGNFDKALEYNFLSLKLREKDGVENEILTSLTNIGLVYLQMNDFTSAIKYLERSYQGRLQNGDSTSVEKTLTNMAFCYIGLNEAERAVEHCLLALRFCEGRCGYGEMMGVIYALGRSYIKLGRYEDARIELERSITMAKKIGSVRHEVESLRGLCEISLLQGNIREAAEYANEAFSNDSKTDLKLDQLESLSMLSTVYSAMGDYQKSYQYQTKYIDLLKSIFSGEMINNLSTTVMKVSEQTNLATIESQRDVIALRERESTQQLLVIVASTILACLLVILSFLLWRDVKLKSRMNLILDQKVRSRTRELEESYRQLEKVSVEQQENINSFSKKVQSGMATLKGIAQVAKMDTDDQKALSYISKIESEAEKLSNISNLN